MSTFYITSNTYTVCTFQMSSEPQKILDDRLDPNVVKGNDIMLTDADRKIDKAFTCRVQNNQKWTFFALGAGLLLAGAPIALFVGCLMIAAYFANKDINHYCSGPLQPGSWRNYNNKVLIRGKKYALTEYSFLVCGSGGLLKPFFNEKYAKKAIGDIQFYNYTELGVNVLGSFLMGYLGATTITSNFAKVGMPIWRGTLNFIAQNCHGLVMINLLTDIQKRYYRENTQEEENDNSFLEQTNSWDYVEKDENPFRAPDKPADFADFWGDLFSGKIQSWKDIKFKSTAINGFCLALPFFNTYFTERSRYLWAKWADEDIKEYIKGHKGEVITDNPYGE